MNNTTGVLLETKVQDNLSDILGEELSQQLLSTLCLASDRQLAELRESLQVLFQWMQENASEKQPYLV
ncbi:hypothetical protein ABES02_29835 [Neobacillus pocheonensis]|uniref:hypothetical protein n=1 Tax=Neobacillus pocheonensis TaxID=363869 RepID=UPI003D2BB7FA